MSDSSLVPEALAAAYRDSDYYIHGESDGLVFHVDRYSDGLKRLLAPVNPPTAAFITACNPYSRLSDDDDNHRANQRLRVRLEALAVKVLPASGCDPRGEWPPEPGFFALGLTLDDARRLGEAFRQNAVIWIDEDAVPRLVLLR